ncbi:MAG: lipoprotein-releasing system ATP-binding protein LolD [Flavobacteriales bacterium]|nr:lipoprotein-releasing system ATP-binding protein LolD [Flavobacteriales bacterium]|tara:strand:- start:1017 stop:1667 length:651 start_codon:yes stop_codon:yes gene_type:complete
MIETKNIHKNFSDLTVLNGVDLLVNKKEIVSIVGASGAGKTTLLQIIGTLEKPDTGSVLFNEKDVAKMGKKELADFRNKNIGFVFQFHNLLPEFTALENVCIPGFIAKRKKKDVESHAKELLKKLGLENRLNHKPNQLSGGEQQRVSVARSLINDPILILADEPSGNLDSKNAESLHEIFFELRDSYNQTFIIVTHNEKLAKLADRKLVMSDGKIV